MNTKSNTAKKSFKWPWIEFKGLQGRIISLLTVPLVFMIVVSAIIQSQIQNLSSNLENLLSDTVPALTTSKEIQQEAIRIDATIASAILLKNNPDEAISKLSDLDTTLDRLDNSFSRYKNLKMTDKASALRNSTSTTLNELVDVTNKIKQSFNEKKLDQISNFYENDFKPKLSKLNDTLGNIELNNSDTIEYEQTHAKELAKQAKWYAIGGSLLATILSLAVSLWMTRKMTNHLSEISTRLADESGQTREQVTEMATSSKNLAESSSKAAAAIQQTSSAVEQIRSTMEQSERNATISSEATKNNVQTVEEGRHSLVQVKNSFEDIREANEEMSHVIDQNNKQISGILSIVKEISDKTEVINDIVFQTKLLSFNASVEAARAGEQGKGFSVVAEEVGHLAVSSGKASQEISQLLEDSRKKINEILEASQRDVNKVATGIKQKIAVSESAVNSSLQTLDKIADTSTHIDHLVHEIATATLEQARGVNEISQSILELNTISDNNMRDGNMIATSAREILNHAHSVDEVVNSLDTVIRGAA